MFKTILVISFLTLSTAEFAYTAECRISYTLTTKKGNLIKKVCNNESTDVWEFSGKKLISGSGEIDYEISEKNQTIYIFRGANVYKQSDCPDSLYLVDLNATPPTVFNFGIKNACNNIEWTSWKGKNGVVAIKHNVKFRYDGKMIIPPTNEEEIYSTISYSAAKGSLEPFVRTLSVAP